MNEGKVLAVLRDMLKAKPYWNSAFEYGRSMQNSLFLLQAKGIDFGLKFENTVQGIFSRELADFVNKNAKYESGHL